MADRESFSENFDNGPHYAGGKWLNRAGRALNALGHGDSPGGWMSSFRGPFGGSLSPAPHFQGIAKITNAGNTCEPDPNEESGQPDAPCAFFGKYLAKFRYWDHHEGRWSEVEEELRLDASGLSPTPAFAEHDTVPAWWNHQRGWLIPIVGPPDQIVSTEWEDNRELPPVELPTLNLADDTVVGTLEVDNGSGWQALSGRDLTIPISTRSDSHRVGTMFTALQAQNGTKIRLTAGVGIGSHARVFATAFGVRLWAVGRGGLPSHADVGVAYGGAALGPLVLHADSAGRFQDSPFFTQVAPGVIQFNVLSSSPTASQTWTIYADFRLEIQTIVTDSSQSSSSSSQSGSSSSPSVSESSASSASGDSSASATSGSCVEVVTDVECIGGNLVVTKCWLCGNGVTSYCDEESPFSSLSTSSGGSSQSTPSSQSLSSPSSLSSSSSSPSSQGMSDSSASSLSSASSQSSSSPSSSSASSESSSSAVCGTCTYTYSTGTMLWSLTANNCTGICMCGPEPGDSGFDGEQRIVACVSI